MFRMPMEAKTQTERYTLLIEDAFCIHDEGCVITGILKGGILKLRDKLWILKADGTILNAAADRLKVFYEKGVNKAFSAGDSTRVGIMIEKAVGQIVTPGDVAANIMPNISNRQLPIENPRLKGLLAGRIDTMPDIIDPLISAEITNNSCFLVASYPIGAGEKASSLESMRFPYLTSREGMNYLPAFTDRMELKRWSVESISGYSTALMGAADLFSIVTNNHAIHGMVVNPFTDNLIWGEELITECKKGAV